MYHFDEEMIDEGKFFCHSLFGVLLFSCVDDWNITFEMFLNGTEMRGLFTGGSRKCRLCVKDFS